MTARRSLAPLEAQRGSWLKGLAKPKAGKPKAGKPRPAAAVTLDGLVAVAGDGWRGSDPMQVGLMEEAGRYKADYVLFRTASVTQPAVAEALVYVDDGLRDEDFAELHRRLWSWGAVPLVYRKTGARVDLLRCAHGPDFAGPDGKVRYCAFRTLDLLIEIDLQIKQKTELVWWDDSMLRAGLLWDDPAVCKQLLSADKAAQRGLVQAIADLDRDLGEADVLPIRLRRRLLVLSLLIAYLEDRKVLGWQDFDWCKPGAEAFFDVLGDGHGLIKLLGKLEIQFNGDVFTLSEADQGVILTSTQIERFAQLVKGHTERSGQMTLWRLYSFRDLPVEMISHVYQLFVKDDPGAVYTPPFLVRLMIAEVLSPKRLDRMAEHSEAIIDPSCGSGVFLVEAYKRLIAHWRSQHDWAQPDIATLRRLMRQVRGVDVNRDAIELTAFSLCLALCEALDVPAIKASQQLFPKLRGSSPDALAKLLNISLDDLTKLLESSPDALTKLLESSPDTLAKLREISLHEWCFFSAKAAGLLGNDVGVVLGNPPFGSKLPTPGAQASYAAYSRDHGALPDKQIAYLFLHESLELLRAGGVLCLLQQYNLLYNQKPTVFRRLLFERWDVREILDFASIRGLFGQGGADTKVVALVIEAQSPPSDRLVLHATFRRTGRVVAQRGFDIDYYDQHWLPRSRALDDQTVWRGDLFGGGRVIDFIARLRSMRTLGAYAEERGWDVGEGFIPGGGRINPNRTMDHVVGKRFLPSVALTASGIDEAQITTVQNKAIEEPRSALRFTAPMLLVREQMDLFSDIVSSGYLTYPDQIVGFCAPKSDAAQLRQVKEWLDDEIRPLRAYVAATSSKIQRATVVTAADIQALPYPESRALHLSANEKILVDDMVDHYREFLRVGQNSAMLGPCPADKLGGFCEVYTRQVNLFYPGLRPLAHLAWPGTICQPFVFGKGKVDWSGVEALRDRLERLLTERQEALIVHRVARIFDGSFIFLLKPDRLRYWLRSVALRDADETLAELLAQAQGL